MPDDRLNPRLRTGAAALVIFALFAVAVTAFHAVARPYSPSVGMSAWTDPDTTFDRLERVLGTVLQRAPLANTLANDGAIVGAMSAADDAKLAKRWTVLDNIAEALTTDDARQRLARRWADKLLLRDEPEPAPRATTDPRGAPVADPQSTIRQLVRAAAQSSGNDRAAKVKAIAAIYQQALKDVVQPWVESEVGLRRVEFVLAEPELTVAVNPIQTLLKPLYARVTTAVASGQVERTLRTAIADDLDPQLAPERLATAIHSDFSARWTWIITASLLLTLAVSAIIGSFLHFLPLIAEEQRRLSALGLAAVTLVVGLLSAFGLPTASPPFLSDAVRQLDVFPHLSIAIVALNAIASGAVAALFVTAWTSFLIDTVDTPHLQRQLTAVRWVFHTATIVMVAGVFQTYAVISWPSASMTPVASKMIAGGAQAAAVAIGIAVSTLLLLIYLPAAQALTGVAKARHDAGDEPQKASINKILEDTGFNESPAKQVLTFAQLLSPLLVAPVASLVGLIGS
jgi:hypothetical protein